MFKKNELNAEDLEKVSGGSGLGYASDEYLPADHGVHISAHEGQYHKNEEVYVVEDFDEESFCWGTLIDSGFSSDKGQIVHKVFIRGFNEKNQRKSSYFDKRREVLFESEKWTLYKKNSL